MARSRAREKRVESLYRVHVADGLRLAQLLCDGDAAACAKRAFIKAVATFRDLRSPLPFDVSFRRIVIRECRRPIIRRRARHKAGGDGDLDLWNAFRALSHRRRSALVLRYYESMTDDQVGEVLGCSTGAARALINRGLAGLQRSAAQDANPARIAGELQRVFRARAGRASEVAEPDPHTLRRAVLGRRANAAGAALAIVAVVVAGIFAVRAGIQADEEPPPTTIEDPPEVDLLSLQDLGLQPDTRIDERPDVATVATGAFAGETWQLQARRGADQQICLTLQVGTEERIHCESRALSTLHAFVDSYDGIDATFITGYALNEVARLTLEVDEGDSIRVDLVPAPETLPRALERRFFVIVLPETLVALDSEETGAAQGLDVIRTVLQAQDAEGTATEHQPIYLGR